MITDRAEGELDKRTPETLPLSEGGKQMLISEGAKFSEKMGVSIDGFAYEVMRLVSRLI